MRAVFSERYSTRVLYPPAIIADCVQMELADVSFKEATQFATEGRCDGFVAVGGGSTMDIASSRGPYRNTA